MARQTRTNGSAGPHVGRSLLQAAFGIETVADLANLKYARWAQPLAALDTTAT
ncbi:MULTISPECIES: hypothetical protein [unclassified Streptomyces]|uniref:hypothetical protein n=1 Tax=unclassified Streptomyces TaxID=2593676 RepID=UPI00342394D5